jgi:hypothetical protein
MTVECTASIVRVLASAAGAARVEAEVTGVAAEADQSAAGSTTKERRASFMGSVLVLGVFASCAPHELRS